MSTNRQPDSKPTVRENGIFRGALYIYEANGEIVLASEIKAILATCPEAARMDHLSMRRFVTRGWLDHDERTMFADIGQLPPASITVWREGHLVERKTYWRLPRPVQTRADPTELRETFFDVVERHLQSDAPVATTLSGGLDSSSITCALARGLGMADRVHAFFHSTTRHAGRVVVDR